MHIGGEVDITRLQEPMPLLVVYYDARRGQDTSTEEFYQGCSQFSF
jgi:hypothetical protein